MIINLPKDMERNTTHRYGPNTFKLHRMPVPRPGQVLGLVGSNGETVALVCFECVRGIGLFELVRGIGLF